MRVPSGLVVTLCSLVFAAVPPRACVAASLPPTTLHVGYRVVDVPCRTGVAPKTITVALWYPTRAMPRRYVYGGPTTGEVAVDAEPFAEGGPYPLLVFSHGYGGGGLGSVFFTESLAARGWIVAAPDHHDQDSAVRIRGGQQSFSRWELWRHARSIAASGPGDRGPFLYRLDELAATLDGVLSSEPLGRLVDGNRIAVGGHSFGGFSALGLCGTLPERRDPRIRAVLLFSTGAGGYLFREPELAAVRLPAMLFLGEAERSEKRGDTSMADLATKVYRSLAPPRYLVEVRGADHFSFNNRFSDTWGARRASGSEAQFDVIRRYATAFLERHVAGRPDGGVLERQEAGLSRYLRGQR